MDSNAVINLIGGVFGLIMIASAAFAVLRSTFIKQQMELLRSQVADYQQRTGYLEGELLRLERELTTVEQLLQQEKQAREVLETVVTGKQELIDLQQKLIEHDRTTRDILTDMDEKLDDISGKVTP